MPNRTYKILCRSCGSVIDGTWYPDDPLRDTPVITYKLCERCRSASPSTNPSSSSVPSGMVGGASALLGFGVVAGIVYGAYSEFTGWLRKGGSDQQASVTPATPQSSNTVPSDSRPFVPNIARLRIPDGPFWTIPIRDLPGDSTTFTQHSLANGEPGEERYFVSIDDPSTVLVAHEDRLVLHVAGIERGVLVIHNASVTSVQNQRLTPTGTIVTASTLIQFDGATYSTGAFVDASVQVCTGALDSGLSSLVVQITDDRPCSAIRGSYRPVERTQLCRTFPNLTECNTALGTRPNVSPVTPDGSRRHRSRRHH